MVSGTALTQLTKRLANELGKADWACFCGSLPPGLAPRDFASMLQTLSARGIQVAVDTSGPSLTQALCSGCKLAKPNLEELASIIAPETVSTSGMAAAARKALALAGNP